MLDVDISEETDLNRVSEVELQMAKAKMEEKFTANQIKPGDPQYEYDKQVRAQQLKQCLRLSATSGRCSTHAYTPCHGMHFASPGLCL